VLVFWTLMFILLIRGIKKMERREYKKLKDKVYLVMLQQPNTRNSDTALMIGVWKEFYSKYISYFQTSISFENLCKVPTKDDIKRIRARIQNINKELLPTLWEVAKHRKWNEQEWKKALGYRVEDPRQGVLKF